MKSLPKVDMFPFIASMPQISAGLTESEREYESKRFCFSMTLWSSAEAKATKNGIKM